MGLFDMLTGGSNQNRRNNNGGGNNGQMYWHRCAYCGRRELAYNTSYLNSVSCPSRPASLPHDFRRV